MMLKRNLWLTFFNIIKKISQSFMNTTNLIWTKITTDTLYKRAVFLDLVPRHEGVKKTFFYWSKLPLQAFLWPLVEIIPHLTEVLSPLISCCTHSPQYNINTSSTVLHLPPFPLLGLNAVKGVKTPRQISHVLSIKNKLFYRQITCSIFISWHSSAEWLRDTTPITSANH